LGVPCLLSDRWGAVSQPVACAMAQGALQRAGGHAQMSLAVTGVAGPEASPNKPVGLVHIAVARLEVGMVRHAEHTFGEIGRDAVREQTVLTALRFVLDCLDNWPLVEESA
jgi:nicotinamide-nucleotide amidase